MVCTQSNNICSKFENANQGKVLKFENSVQNRTFFKKTFWIWAVCKLKLKFLVLFMCWIFFVLAINRNLLSTMVSSIHNNLVIISSLVLSMFCIRFGASHLFIFLALIFLDGHCTRCWRIYVPKRRNNLTHMCSIRLPSADMLDPVL